MTTRDVGDRVGLEHLVYDDTATLVDATVALTVTAPDGTTSTPSVTHASTGTYTADFDLTSAGVWFWVWSVSGTVVDVETGQITASDPGPVLYSSLARLKKALNMAPTNVSDDEALLSALNTASRDVEQFCGGRVFYLAATATARTFSTRWTICNYDGERLPVDDIGVSDITVEVGDGTAWTEVTGFETYPENALAKGQAITAIVLPPTCSASFRWNRKARITTRFGAPQEPPAVEEATYLRALRLYRRPGSPDGVGGSAEFGFARPPHEDPDFIGLLAYLQPVLVA